MTEYIYKFNTGATLAREVWQDASHEELRVLVYLMTTDGAMADEISAACGTAKARTKSALALWREAGVILRESTSARVSARKVGAEADAVKERLTPPTDSPSLTLEFEDRHTAVGVDEMTSIEAADSIRDAALAELMSDIASLLSKPALNTYEAKHIAAAYGQYAVSSEYILTLATYMSETAAAKGRGFTTKILTDKISRLVGRGIDNLEALEAYIEDQSRGGEYYELRRIFSIWKRNPSKTELKYFKKWTEELDYGTEIIDEARDIAVTQTGEQPFAYIDKLLVSWHAAGLRTLGEIAKYNEEHKPERTTPKKSGGKPKSVETPAYSSFNTEDALLRALERSYADDKDD